jgi:hypothetical protein
MYSANMLTGQIEKSMGTLSPNQAFVEMNRPFRFSDSKRITCMALLGVEALTRSSQTGSHVRETTEFVKYELQQSKPKEVGSKLRIIEASALLPNLAWYKGKHLKDIVTLAGEVLKVTDNPLIAREHASAALKNSTWYEGVHVLFAVEAALKHGARNPKGSDRITDGCVRAILYAARHSRKHLTNKAVLGFLQNASSDINPVIANNATQALGVIFG